MVPALGFNQSALIDLQAARSGDSRERRRRALADLQELAKEQAGRCFEPSPEALIRQDRLR
jgi:hypothetical protein